MSKLYFTAAADPITTRIGAGGREPGDTYYRAFSIVNGGRALESDLFEGLRQRNSHVAVAA